MHRLTRLPLRGVYVITDGPRADLIGAVEAALRGGAAVIQYRDKTIDDSRRRAEASALLVACRERRAPLIINDDVELAAEIHADGVHLGEEDADIVLARSTLGADAIIGVSCYDSVDRAKSAASAGANYLAFGAFFSSPTKPNARRATTELLIAARSFHLPLVAIGGITPDNAPPLIAAGANFLAVVSGIFSAPDIELATQQYNSLFPNEKF
ncbi:MAG: thiamine phosphate synthase [Rudaea sp.]